MVARRLKYEKHGDYTTRLYNIWGRMKARCANPKSDAYKYYGARGISVCAEWQCYVSFKAWALANGYSDELQIDRIDSDGNYCPQNCRWVTPSQNIMNRRPVTSAAKRSSRFIGVSWREARSAWRAQIWHDGKTIEIGSYRTEEEAALAYDAKAIQLRGASAQLNFPSTSKC